MIFTSNYARLSFSKFTKKGNKFRNIPKGDQNAIVLYLIIEMKSILGINEDKIYNWMNSLLDSNLSVKSIFLGLKKVMENKDFYMERIHNTARIPINPMYFIAICKREFDNTFFTINNNPQVKEIAEKCLLQLRKEFLRIPKSAPSLFVGEVSL
jgi:hypothetical protein